MSRPNVTGQGVEELVFGSADPLPGCIAGQTLRVSIDVDGRPALMLGSSRAHVSDRATLDLLIAGLAAARDRTPVTPAPPARGPEARRVARVTKFELSPDLDSYAEGRIDAHEIRCVLCKTAPCACTDPAWSPQHRSDYNTRRSRD